jgi:hypothetical protein
MYVIAVESTALSTVGYDEARALLRIEFCNRAVYQYFGVPAAVHQALLGSASKGSYFNQRIRGRFPFSQVSDWHADVPVAPSPVGTSRR